MKGLKAFLPASLIAISTLVLPWQINLEANNIVDFANRPIVETSNAQAASWWRVCIKRGHLNVRSGPSTGHRYVGKLYKGQWVKVIKWSYYGDWVLISANGGVTYGWAAAWHICR